jgi:hypothetical protein
MNRPPRFQSQCLTTQNTPYMFAAELVPAITYDGGVLGKGQLIWTCEVDGAKERPHLVTAFVDDLGLIWLDPRSLMRAGSVGNYGIEVNAVQHRREGCSLGGFF